MPKLNPAVAVNDRKLYWHWRDEILRVIHWLVSQDLQSEVGLSDLSKWLNSDDQTLKPHLDRMVEEGYVEEKSLKLTERGLVEAKKRFVDEFQIKRYSHDHSDCPPEAPCHEE